MEGRFLRIRGAFFLCLALALGASLIHGCSKSDDTDLPKVPAADGGVPLASIEPGDTEALERVTKLAKEGDARARFELGVYYEREKDPENAKFWYTLAVEKGLLEAHVNLGRMYYEGNGIEANPAKALELFRAGADQGDAASQYNLGRMYQEGTGVDPDLDQAKTWLRRAADQGLADAQNHLGAVYNNAESPDFEEAKKWYWLACKQSHAHAQYNLGVMYYNGQGSEVDYVRAYIWIYLGSLGGHAMALQNVGAVEKKLSPAAAESARAIADDWETHLSDLSPL